MGVKQKSELVPEMTCLTHSVALLQNTGAMQHEQIATGSEGFARIDHI
jgi:hypothetical protein